ncbi:hypothetical protein Q5H93_18910 [Hymenobacter sp. ASUV-10]|uniref:Carboxypeptidase regulatory-like domain-containing protein n=1 Tax=Hymenobacter aranciens TaxID=3063996 RepID=A0ABT9BJW4_9BACT|nr:hypothetical protein [Hymenobacter sp. ASUV-10]MDO7876823.1 hypothetical protein [Hymenobacter sp. ASUV-10]
MRSILLLLAATFLLLFHGQAQPLQGGFITEQGKAEFWMHSDFFWFNNGRFVYHNDRGRYGGGTFQLAGDSLILQFDTWTKPPLPIRIDTIAPIPGRLTGIRVRVLDEGNQEGLPGTSISSTTHPDVSTATNMDGQAYLNYTPTAGDSIRAHYLSYEKVTFATMPGDNREYTISLRPQSSRMPSGTQKVYLLERRGSRLLMQMAYPFTGLEEHYRPLSARKSRQMLRWHRRHLPNY